MAISVFLALIAHFMVILGVSFSPDDTLRPETNTLDIVLVELRSEEQPEEADYLAQANLDGGGDSDEKTRPTTPVPPTFVSSTAQLTAVAPPSVPTVPVLSDAHDSRAEVTPQASRPQKRAPLPVLAQTEVETTRTVSDAEVSDSEPAALAVDEQHIIEPETDDSALAKVPLELSDTPSELPAPQAPTVTHTTQSIDATTLINRSMEMASVSAEIAEKLKAYAERPRRKWVTSRTKQHDFAAYMQAWRAKVERFGNLNYPDEARRQRLSGSLLLDVAINPDGSINEITLRRSSGKAVLDDAAIRIVKLAAPFARFPASFNEEIDILHIERTWEFLSNNQMSTQ